MCWSDPYNFSSLIPINSQKKSFFVIFLYTLSSIQPQKSKETHFNNMHLLVLFSCKIWVLWIFHMEQWSPSCVVTMWIPCSSCFTMSIFFKFWLKVHFCLILHHQSQPYHTYNKKQIKLRSCVHHNATYLILPPYWY
jgi:hypothetical protein